VASLDVNFERLDIATALLESTLEKIAEYRRVILRRVSTGSLVGHAANR
jgi:hypothetical protein